MAPLNRYLSRLPGMAMAAAAILMAWPVMGGSKAIAQDSQAAEGSEASEAAGRVTGLRYITIHVLDLERTMTLYEDILGFELIETEVLQTPGLEGMVLMKMRAGDLTITLSVPPADAMDGYGPVGNTNHNHFMLSVDDVGPIGDRLLAAGYALENAEYRRDLYTFFTGPNGEIVGLAAW